MREPLIQKDLRKSWISPLRQEFNKRAKGFSHFCAPDRGTYSSYVSMHTVKKTNRAYHVPNSTRTGMEDRVHEQASLLLIDSQIDELEQRLNALQEVIVAMTAAGGDVREQAELMLKMLRMRRALAIFRAELKDGVMAQYGNGEAL